MDGMMKALVHDGYGHIELTDRPCPRIRERTDAIVRVTRSTICTSDLHIMHGAVPRALPDRVLGHEFVGVIEEVGADVRRFAPGDRVAVNVETFCGECFFCRHGYVNNCERGGWELGCTIDGCQAEYVRVPFADNGFTRIPDTVGDEDALFLGDILATGYWAVDIAELRGGDTVAVIGAGPVGLTSMMCARLRRPSHIVAIDVDASRLDRARAEGLADVTVNPRTGAVTGAPGVVAGGMAAEAGHELVERVCRTLTCGRGADAVIEAAGGADTFEMAWRIARPNAVVSVAAMYERDQVLPLPSMYGKNLIFKTGGVDANDLGAVMDLIERGRIDTGCLISKRYPLNGILEAYRAFEAHEDGCLKVVLTPYER